MARTVSATQARVHLGELMRSAIESREPIIVERGGRRAAVLLSIAEYERLLRGAPQEEDWSVLLAAARAQATADLGGRALLPPVEALRQAREERGEQLVAVR